MPVQLCPYSRAIVNSSSSIHTTFPLNQLKNTSLAVVLSICPLHFYLEALLGFFLAL